jgi:diguanylate cyclase (GGDEF)-like protein
VRVLVVDDDADGRATVARAVREAGYVCETAADGEEAWALHQRQPADVILADWVMPRAAGTELCRRVRAHDRDRYTYFVLVTALDDKDHLLGGMSSGADDYVVKPVDFDELRARLVAAERMIRAHRQLLGRNQALRRQSQRLRLASRVDHLTGVANRVRLAVDLAAARARVAAEGLPCSVGLCDIDRFKQYNDHFGHRDGDGVLRVVAHTLVATLRGADSVYRYGGEEFLVLLAGQSLANARAAMERARRAVEDLGIGAHPEGVVTISVGVAESRTSDGAGGEPLVGDGIDASSDAWLRRADAALYRAKALGRNRVETDG